VKLDTITISDKRTNRNNNTNAIKLLQQKLRNFFNEENGHGSLMLKPPPTMFTPQYFKTVRKITKYSIERMDWISVITTAKFKKKFASCDNTIKMQRSNSIFNTMRLNIKK
jgi:hypothetical protein